MRRLISSVCLIVALAGAAGVHVWHLSQHTHSIAQQLTQAQHLVEQGNWADAYQLTQQAWEQWESQTFYLHITLHHQDIDQVSTAFGEALAILKQQEQPGEYVATNARILYQLELLVEAELPSVKNIL